MRPLHSFAPWESSSESTKSASSKRHPGEKLCTGEETIRRQRGSGAWRKEVKKCKGHSARFVRVITAQIQKTKSLRCSHLSDLANFRHEFGKFSQLKTELKKSSGFLLKLDYFCRNFAHNPEKSKLPNAEHLKNIAKKWRVRFELDTSTKKSFLTQS